MLTRQKWIGNHELTSTETALVLKASETPMTTNFDHSLSRLSFWYRYLNTRKDHPFYYIIFNRL